MTSEASTSELLAFALELADEADRFAMSFYRGDLGTEQKADGTLVTRADRAIEEHLRQRIAARFPAHAILAEEQGYSAGTEGSTRWIIDPIDGTHGFARGVPVWATLIACERAGVIEVGVASAPALGTRWWAARGLGAWRAANAVHEGAPERIAVSSVATIEEAQVLYGSYRLCVERWPATFAPLLLRSWRQRGFGDFWGHCLVAEGAAEVMLEGAISPWDIAALQVIVEEAGGHLTDGADARTIDAGYSVTSNAALHPEVLRALGK
ncbi:MAG: histidinol-phosphatase [Chloroflexi bacterium]|nr:MAG: histidinol-phosphatase [Chloroflexota bacterium]